MPYFIRNGVVITNVQSQILSDATPFAGADVATIKTKQKATIAHSHFTQTDDVNENVLYTAAAANQEIEIEIDLNTLTQWCIIREYVQTDGTNYRLISTRVFPGDFDASTKIVIINFKQKSVLYKISIQSGVAEGATRDIPLRVATVDRS